MNLPSRRYNLNSYSCHFNRRLSGLENIRAFQYRLSRQAAGFRVEFVTGAGTAIGQCRNISPSGIQAHFDLQLEEGSSGRLALYLAAGRCEVGAVVKRVAAEETALEFRCETPYEEQRLADLLGSEEKIVQPPSSTNTRFPR